MANRNFGWALVLLAVCAVVPGDALCDAGLLLQEGRDLLGQKRYEEALGMFESLTVESPGYFWGWYYTGLCYWQLKEPVEAGYRLGEAVKLDPDRFEGRYLYGNVLRGFGKPDEAVAELQAALGLARNDREWLMASAGYSDALVRAGRYDDARAQLEAHLEKKPSSPRELALLSKACQKGGDYRSALRTALELRNLQPGYEGIDRRIAELYGYLAWNGVDAAEAAGLREEAVAEGMNWLGREPDSVDARLHVAGLLLRLKRYDQAMAMIEQVPAVAAESCDVKVMTARLAVLMNGEVDAMEPARQAAACFDEDAESRELLARAHLVSVRRIIEEGDLPDRGEEAREHFAGFDQALAGAGEVGAMAKLHGERQALERSFGEKLAIETENNRIHKLQMRELRCKQLSAQYWDYMHADDTGVDVEPLTGEDRSFLRDVCDVSL